MTKTRDLANLGGGFIQAGTGAVQRTVESKLQDMVSVRDFGAVGDGVTNDTAAIQAAVNYAISANKIVYAPSGTYLINGEVSFVSVSLGLQVMGIVGDGPDLTIFSQANNNSDTFSFKNQDASQQYCIRPIVKSLSIEYSSVSSANTGTAIRHRESLNGIIAEVVIESAPYGIYGERSVQVWHDKVYYRTGRVLTGHFTKAFLVLDTNLEADYGGSFGNFISDCEMQTGRGCDYSLWIRSTDGLYVTNCHLNFAKTTVFIDCDGTGGRESVRHCLFSNNYFDSDGSYNDYTVFVRASGAGGAATLFGFHFSNNVFRAQADQTIGFRVAGSEAEMQGLSYLKRVSFVGNEFLGYVGGGINLSLHTSYDPKLLISDVTVIGNSFINESLTAGAPAISSQGVNWNISGNIYTGYWPDGGFPLISVSKASRCSINGETFNVAKLVPIDTDPGTTEDILIYGNVDSDTAQYVSEVLEEGTDPDDHFIKYKDGRLVCRKRIAATGVDINTTYGSLFISGNLATGLHAFAEPFIAVPHVECTACVTDVATWPVMAGTTSTTQFPSDVSIVCAISVTNRAVTIWLEATGRWKA